MVRGDKHLLQDAHSHWRPLWGLEGGRMVAKLQGIAVPATEVDTSPRPALFLSAVYGREEPRPGKQETRFHLPALLSLDVMQVRTCPDLSFLVGTCLREQSSDQRTLHWLKPAQRLASCRQPVKVSSVGINWNLSRQHSS